MFDSIFDDVFDFNATGEFDMMDAMILTEVLYQEELEAQRKEERRAFRTARRDAEREAKRKAKRKAEH